jgi:hypothetical protein
MGVKTIWMEPIGGKPYVVRDGEKIKLAVVDEVGLEKQYELHVNPNGLKLTKREDARTKKLSVQRRGTR